MQGQTDEALTLYEQAQVDQPSWPIALALFRLRRSAERADPEQSLRAWLGDNPQHVPALMTLAQASQRSHDDDQAIDYYERALAQDPDNVLAANNLAWLYLDRGRQDDLTRALDTARIAYTGAPSNIDIADTYGWMLHNNDQDDVARGVFESALAASSADKHPDLAFHFATTLADQGKRLAARDLLDEALRTSEPFASRAEAEALRIQLER